MKNTLAVLNFLELKTVLLHPVSYMSNKIIIQKVIGSNYEFKVLIIIPLKEFRI